MMLADAADRLRRTLTSDRHFVQARFETVP
jgi:hypothetical protein